MSHTRFIVSDMIEEFSSIRRINSYLLSCQPRVTGKSCFVYKVIRNLLSIDHLCINPTQDRINTQVIYRFALAQVECKVIYLLTN